MSTENSYEWMKRVQNYFHDNDETFDNIITACHCHTYYDKH